MRFLWKNYLFAVSFFGIIAVAPFVHAACPTTGGIPNPIAACDFLDLVDSIFRQLLPIAGTLAAVAIIFVGFKLLLASIAGNPGKIEEAKKMLWYVLLGSAIIVGSSVLAKAVINFVRTLQ